MVSPCSLLMLIYFWFGWLTVCSLPYVQRNEFSSTRRNAHHSVLGQLWTQSNDRYCTDVVCRHRAKTGSVTVYRGVCQGVSNGMQIGTVPSHCACFMPLCQPLSFLCEWFASVVSAYLGFNSAFHLYSESRKVVKYINSCCWLLRQRPLPASNILQSALVPTRAVRNGHSYGYPQFRGDAVGRATHCPIGWHHSLLVQLLSQTALLIALTRPLSKLNC